MMILSENIPTFQTPDYDDDDDFEPPKISESEIERSLRSDKIITIAMPYDHDEIEKSSNIPSVPEIVDMEPSEVSKLDIEKPTKPVDSVDQEHPKSF